MSSIKQDIVNQSHSLHSDPSIKENCPQSPTALHTPPLPKPLQPTGNSVLFPINKTIQHQEETATDEEMRDPKKIDSEMEEIQVEINKLTSRLDALRLEKAERKVKALQKLGRMVPAKFMEQKKNVTKTDETKINQRRGLTMGPSEIAAGFRRGVSMGPAEIFLGTSSRQEVAATTTPVQPMQDPRKSCFWKLEDVDEKRAVTKERASSFTVRPKWREETKTNSPALRRQAAAAVGSKKPVKKQGGITSSSIQHKTLFRDGDNKSVVMRKQSGREVGSLYNPLSSKYLNKNRSLPENEEEEETKKKTGEEMMGSYSPGNWVIASEEETQLGYGMRKKGGGIFQAKL